MPDNSSSVFDDVQAVVFTMQAEEIGISVRAKERINSSKSHDGTKIASSPGADVGKSKIGAKTSNTQAELAAELDALGNDDSDKEDYIEGEKLNTLPKSPKKEDDEALEIGWAANDELNALGNDDPNKEDDGEESPHKEDDEALENELNALGRDDDSVHDLMFTEQGNLKGDKSGNNSGPAKEAWGPDRKNWNRIFTSMIQENKKDQDFRQFLTTVGWCHTDKDGWGILQEKEKPYKRYSFSMEEFENSKSETIIIPDMPKFVETMDQQKLQKYLFAMHSQKRIMPMNLDFYETVWEPLSVTENFENYNDIGYKLDINIDPHMVCWVHNPDSEKRETETVISMFNRASDMFTPVYKPGDGDTFKLYNGDSSDLGKCSINGRIDQIKLDGGIDKLKGTKLLAFFIKQITLGGRDVYNSIQFLKLNVDKFRWDEISPKYIPAKKRRYYKLDIPVNLCYLPNQTSSESPPTIVTKQWGVDGQLTTLQIMDPEENRGNGVADVAEDAEDAYYIDLKNTLESADTDLPTPLKKALGQWIDGQREQQKKVGEEKPEQSLGSRVGSSLKALGRVALREFGNALSRRRQISDESNDKSDKDLLKIEASADANSDEEVLKIEDSRPNRDMNMSPLPIEHLHRVDEFKDEDHQGQLIASDAQLEAIPPVSDNPRAQSANAEVEQKNNMQNGDMNKPETNSQTLVEFFEKRGAFRCVEEEPDAQTILATFPTEEKRRVDLGFHDGANRYNQNVRQLLDGYVFKDSKSLVQNETDPVLLYYKQTAMQSKIPWIDKVHDYIAKKQNTDDVYDLGPITDPGEQIINEILLLCKQGTVNEKKTEDVNFASLGNQVPSDLCPQIKSRKFPNERCVLFIVRHEGSYYLCYYKQDIDLLMSLSQIFSLPLLRLKLKGAQKGNESLLLKCYSKPMLPWIEQLYEVRKKLLSVNPVTTNAINAQQHGWLKKEEEGEQTPS
jgi:hypothetical protein